MAVTGPRVGSSAFAETGFREMSKAREKLRLVARPGKLSEMIGKSVGFFFNPVKFDGRTVQWYGYAHGGMPENSGSGSPNLNGGSISGDTTFEGHKVTGGPIVASDRSRGGPGVDYHIVIAGLKNAAMRMTLVDGATSQAWDLNYVSIQNQDCYKYPGDRNSLVNFIASRVGKQILVVLSRR